MKAFGLILTFLVAFAAVSFANNDSPDNFDDDFDAYVVRQIAVPASYNTIIYYPACEAGKKDIDECKDDLSTRATFSGVILHQGGSVDANYYSQIATKLARRGYIVAVPNVPRITVGTSVFQLTNTNVTVATKLLLQTLNADTTSPLNGRLTPDSFALLGHSFGGVVALIAGSTTGPALCANPANGLAQLCGGFTGFGSGLKAVIVYGTALVQRTRFGVSTVNITAGVSPVIFVRGKNDGVVARVDVVSAYDQILGTTKAFIELESANHFGIADLQIVPNATVDTAVQPVSQDSTTNKLAKVFTIGLFAHLGNPRNNKGFKYIYDKQDLKVVQTNVTASVVA